MPAMRQQRSDPQSSSCCSMKLTWRILLKETMGKKKEEEQEKNLHKGVLLLPTRERGRKKNGSIQFSRGSRDPNPNPRRSSSSPSFTFFLHSLFFAGRSPTTISLSFPLASKAPQVNGVVAVLVLYFLLSPHFFSFFPILHNIFLSYCAL